MLLAVLLVSACASKPDVGNAILIEPTLRQSDTLTQLPAPQKAAPAPQPAAPSGDTLPVKRKHNVEED